ncbi:DUF11 domain-containing protein [Spirosoma fluviale]|uniref:Conserved repeat domain-containing protein n=1 Tax=Spirosoma fluviale TaxID=1597977 RepID=A0A286G301_9BACT|nr:DUF11 domain-containing protein [Spirosoma fluviale]SOD89901.1 conserved repeat domain-containing protein [Spirosoma fluviale]
MPIRTLCRFLVSWALLSSPLFSYAQNQPGPAPQQDTLRRMAEEEQRRLIDPATGTVPYERLDEARRQLNNQSTTATGAPVAQSGIPNMTWQERGPSNVGGRTRALLFDPNDPTRKKVWAGSLAGGLWYTNDITDASAVWTPVSDVWESMVVTSIAADPSNPQIMYAGTGDAYGYVTGGGIWKTTNGGTSWVRLSSTIPGGNPPALSYSFGYIQRIVVTSNGQVFAATRLGLVRSGDGGTTWQYTLAPNQGIGVTGGATGNYYNDLVTDLEWATDGIFYVGFNPSRVFKSTDKDGSTWIEISPVGSAGGEQTELALAPSTSGASQVIYGVSRGYNNINYGQDVKWFKKSINGGSTWTDVQIPTFSWGSHFTNGNGYYALSLVVHPSDANTVYAGGYNWFRTVDGGSSWSNPLTNAYGNFYALVFQPGNIQSTALCSDKGVFWSANWNDVSLTQPTILDRNNGYRINETNSVAMKSSPGSAYLLGTSRNGAFKLTANGLSAGSVFYQNSYDMGLSFIDDDTPSSQVFLTSGSVYLYNGTSTQYITGLNTSSGGADYDSQTNTLYAADYNYPTSQYFIRKVTGIGTNVSITQLPLAGLTNTPSFVKLNKAGTVLFAGSYPGKLYKISNLSESTPSVTYIDNGALPQYTSVSCIDIGSNDNELLVTLSNYGVQSVWYTNDGGQSWVGKDQSNYGLPDVPVRAALFNPQNRRQVLLATELGVWSTTDITTSNPGWTFTSTGMGSFRVNQLRYRASDGRVAAATYGRGIFSSDAFAIPYTLPSITLTNVSNMTLCGGNTFTVSFSTAGPAFTAGNTFEVWLSDAMGSFTNARKIGSSTTSPITATLPNGSNALPYGTNYQVKVVATNPDVESGPSGALVIGNLTYVSLNDRRVEVGSNYGNGFICTGSSAKLLAILANGNTATGDVSYQWFLNNNLVTGATASTYIARQAGNYTVSAKQGNCTVTSQYQLDINSFTSAGILAPTGLAPQCADRLLTIATDYIGETASFQWTRNGVAITGATSYSYTTNLTGSYAAQITDGTCVFNSSPAYFQFGQSLFAKAYTNAPGDTLICTASNTGIFIYPTLPYLANGYSLKWYRNGVLLYEANPATTNSSYYADQPGIYYYVLKQGACQTTSNAVTIADASALTIDIKYDYNTKSFCPGESRYLYTNFISGSFQWQKDGVDITGATSNGYSATATGSYTVRITRGVCSATSLPVSLTFSNAIQPRFSSNNYTKTACSFISIAPDYYSLNGYQYRWYLNGALISTATNSNYYPNQSGNYSVRVTNGSCTGLSNEIYVNINNGQTDKPRITTPVNRQLCANNSLLLTATYYNGILQWKRNGIPIDGARNFQFYATQSGIYSVVVQDGSCSAESDPVEVKIGEATTATLSGNALISAGQSVKLPVAFTGPAPWSVSLANGQSITATYQNPAFITVSPTTNTTYQLASVINACGTGITSGQASVSVGIGSADVALNMAVSNRSPRVGDVISYTLSATNAGPDNAQGIQLSSLLPTGLSFVSSSSPGVSAANGLVSATLGTIPANSQSAISFLATPTLPGTFATAAQITASLTPDPDSQPNSGTGDGQDDAVMVDLRTTSSGAFTSSDNPNQLPLPVVSTSQPATDPNTADLSLSLRVDKLTLTTTDILSTSITVSNRGGASVASVIVELVLPNGTASPVSQVNWVGVSGQVYKGYINQLAAGQSASLVLRWQATGSGTLKAQVLDASEADSDSTPGNGYSKGEDDEATIQLRVR